MRFARDGCILEGAAGCEVRWELREESDAASLVILGKDGVTCRLSSDDRRTWRGRWLHHERMPVELVLRDKIT
jgi:hypothetical protein